MPLLLTVSAQKVKVLQVIGRYEYNNNTYSNKKNNIKKKIRIVILKINLITMITLIIT